MTRLIRAMLVAGLLLAAACESTSDSTITVKEAEQKVEDYFRNALGQLPDQAEPVPGLIDTYDCDDPTDNGPQGRKVSSVHYELHDLPTQEYPEYISTLEQWWRDHNFRILDDERPADQSIWVENNDDGFRMRVTATEGGKFILIATSPCVWPNGTPEPE